MIGWRVVSSRFLTADGLKAFPAYLAVLLACTAAGPVSAVGQALSFNLPLLLPSPAHKCLAVVDVNHDGAKDILAGGRNDLWVFLGNGKGEFAEGKGSPFKAGPSPGDLAIGDFNRDGNVDVAVANHGEKLVTVLLGNGKGGFSFGPGSPFSVASTPHPHGIVAADFNGDGILDIAVDSWQENKVLVLPGKGDGTFETPGTKFDVGREPYQRLRSADLNGDGHPDIVTSNWEGGSVTVLLGDGRGGFARAGGKDIPVPAYPFCVAIADFDGDQKLDIAIGHYSGHADDPRKDGLSLLYGDGHGGFSLAGDSPVRVGHYPAMITAADVNADGIADIILPNTIDKTVTVFLGGRHGIRQADGSPIPVGADAQTVAVDDLNGDGKGDLVVGSLDTDEIRVFLQK
jgi:hypothetical protein